MDTSTSKNSDTSGGESSEEAIIASLINKFEERSFRNSDLEEALPQLSKEARVGVLNKLIKQDLIEVCKSKGVLEYKFKQKQTDDCSDIVGLDKEERVVYRIIKQAGNKGIWMRDIRFKSNIILAQLNKILKSLENKKVIKAVKCVSAYKKKVYMLYDLEPDSTLTGGSWYCDQDFESEFVDVLNQQCYRYLLEMRAKAKDGPDKKKGPLAIQNLSSALPKEVWQFITDLGISKIPLSEEDIKTILDTLYYDGKVERKLTTAGVFVYRAVEPLIPMPGVTVVPCSVCPLVQHCNENTEITSIKCPYFKQWNEKKILAKDNMAEEEWDIGAPTYVAGIKIVKKGLPAKKVEKDV